MSSSDELTARGPAAAFARALGITTRTLAAWKLRNGFPQNGTVGQVREWAGSVGLGRSYERADSADLRALRAELLREQIEHARYKNSRERSTVVDRIVVRKMLGLLGTKLDLLLRLKLEVELGSRVAGKSAAEANVEGAMILDEIREVVNSNLATFEANAVKESERFSGAGAGNAG